MRQKTKGRISIILSCFACFILKKIKQNNYRTTKNKKNTPKRLKLKKFCFSCNKHTFHKEIK